MHRKFLYLCITCYMYVYRTTLFGLENVSAHEMVNVGSHLVLLSKCSGMLLTLSRVALWLYPLMSMPSVRVLTWNSVGRNAMISHNKLLFCGERTYNYVCRSIHIIYHVYIIIILIACNVCWFYRIWLLCLYAECVSRSWQETVWEW